jgi:hypothetical protein
VIEDQDERDPLGGDDGYVLGCKIVEMADRVKIASSIVPGAQALGQVIIDDVAFDIIVKLAASSPDMPLLQDEAD